ncbi:2Fe-2S iron-sulfur cluster-binding protein [Sphingobacterium sp. SGR-19]|uniref:2Fe-2S iron-sulfur cluster-binding protein n=1 Tax=Sphingobacterium sp. SGR-19 TaxID=2710886 RepID=UPI0013ED2891|nr:2Fe-2S iron-sulfur cluster-binding protein [Sphingobacterium sp. SGR-19]NGM65342.1 2Fe-2S iron-sulfur cluster binding domain-containing protein [Sphingobacterium sp. SGR-19]
MENIINITVEDRDGTTQTIEVPTDINLSLMEILKASDYNILATCGGMALCATCHIQVLDGGDRLPEATDQELDMLDTLPDADMESRLACQLNLTNNDDGLKVKIKGAVQ